MQTLPLCKFYTKFLSQQESDTLMTWSKHCVTWTTEKFAKVYSPYVCVFGDKSIQLSETDGNGGVNPWPHAFEKHLLSRIHLFGQQGKIPNLAIAHYFTNGTMKQGKRIESKNNLDSNTPISILIVGTPRKLSLHARFTGDSGSLTKIEYHLGHGSLLVIPPETYSQFKWEIPTNSKVDGSSVVYVFRHLNVVNPVKMTQVFNKCIGEERIYTGKRKNTENCHDLKRTKHSEILQKPSTEKEKEKGREMEKEHIKQLSEDSDNKFPVISKTYCWDPKEDSLYQLTTYDFSNLEEDDFILESSPPSTLHLANKQETICDVSSYFCN